MVDMIESQPQDILRRLSPYWLCLVLALPALTMICPFLD